LNLGEDEEWVRRALVRGSLLPVHDGSYMIELCVDVCSEALVLLYVRTGRMATVTVVERTDAKTASKSNCCGELLGGLLLSLLLCAATLDPTLEYAPVAQLGVTILVWWVMAMTVTDPSLRNNLKQIWSVHSVRSWLDFLCRSFITMFMAIWTRVVALMI
jgi:hypothetical protein